MKPKLSRAASQLREQIDDSFPDRDRTSDGWIGDTRHAARKSDHNPDEQGWIHRNPADPSQLRQVGHRGHHAAPERKGHFWRHQGNGLALHAPVHPDALRAGVLLHHKHRLD